MVKTSKIRPVLIALIASLMISLAACIGIAPQGSPQLVNPTIIITQYVTQVVATVTPGAPAAAAPTQQQGAQGAQVGPSAGPSDGQPAQSSNQRMKAAFDPFKVDIYYPLKGCVASRLHVKDKAFVAYNGEDISIYHSPDLGDAPIWRDMSTGEVVTIIDGPWCDMGSIVWRVSTDDGLEGYVPEGNGNIYWMLPLGETVNKLEKPEIESVAPQSSISRLGLPAQCLPR